MGKRKQPETSAGNAGQKRIPEGVYDLHKLPKLIADRFEILENRLQQENYTRKHAIKALVELRDNFVSSISHTREELKKFPTPELAEHLNSLEEIHTRWLKRIYDLADDYGFILPPHERSHSSQQSSWNR